MAKNSDKLNAFAGIAAVSAVIAMVLVLSNLFVIVPLASDFISQIPAWTGNVEDLFRELTQIDVRLQSVNEGMALLAIGGLMTLSITSTVAAAKIAR